MPPLLLWGGGAFSPHAQADPNPQSHHPGSGGGDHTIHSTWGRRSGRGEGGGGWGRGVGSVWICTCVTCTHAYAYVCVCVCVRACLRVYLFASMGVHNYCALPGGSSSLQDRNAAMPFTRECQLPSTCRSPASVTQLRGKK